MKALILGLCSLALTQSAWSRPLDITTEDNVRIHAEISGKGTHGVLLIHDRDRSSVAWKLFAEKLAAKGFRVLAIDLRGHGKSAKAPGEQDYTTMVHDVEAGLKTLRRYQLKGISLVGADLGANLALQVAANDPKITNIVLLSPGFNIKGIKATSNLTTYGERPILLAAAQGDEAGGEEEQTCTSSQKRTVFQPRA